MYARLDLPSVALLPGVAVRRCCLVATWYGDVDADAVRNIAIEPALPLASLNATAGEFNAVVAITSESHYYAYVTQFLGFRALYAYFGTDQ
ncbi:hypothetical protein OUZ56_011774 [Daphnia magna]|uniref:Uncharacterized protein n=1 Tax=Daphnia magna TaxID=35525 RepID=A0ABQ9Z138_9CRUS|nr:hypothetical protein OUZ56_011774 [Daphnia magna]